MSITQVYATHVGPVDSFHIEVRCSNFSCVSHDDMDAYDFDNQSYGTASTPGMDVRLAVSPEVPLDILGFKKLVGLNGAQLANLGIVDFDSISCSNFETSVFSDIVPTTLPDNQAPIPQTVFLVETDQETKAKLLLVKQDATAPNGLIFDYEIIDCHLFDLINEVEDLVDNETLNNGNGNSLINKLDGALLLLEKNNTTGTCGKLGDFINQVNALINSGKLTSEDGQPLIDTANEIMTSIPC